MILGANYRLLKRMEEGKSWAEVLCLQPDPRHELKAGEKAEARRKAVIM